jgi:hypothetical protein
LIAKRLFAAEQKGALQAAVRANCDEMLPIVQING